jgi:DNA polymerase-3 subunit chi
MKKNSEIKVIFFPVKDNQAKIQLICFKVQQAINQEKRILITVPTEEAAKYIDSLLWRIPEESFIPHAIAQTPVKEWVAITPHLMHNLNEAHYLLNLCPQICPIYQHFEEIYELYDETHPQKTEWAQKRLQDYQSKGLITVKIL